MFMTLLETATTNENNNEVVNESIQSTESTEHREGSLLPESDGTTIEANKWYWNEEQPGQGDKPSWLMEKYNSVEAQAKANVDAQKYIGELNKRLGEFARAPDAYDYAEVEKDGFTLDKESALFKQFEDFARTQNMSQGLVDNILTIYKNEYLQKTPNVDQEMAKLGPDANGQLQSLTNWASNNLSDDEFYTLTEMINTADKVRVLQKLRSLTMQTPVPTPQQVAQHTPRMSENQLFSDYISEWEKIKDDPAKQQEWQEKFRKFYG
jgi:hypothetical protein